jgi:hypothetical protein
MEPTISDMFVVGFAELDFVSVREYRKVRETLLESYGLKYT